LDSLQDDAEDSGEPGLYLLLFLVTITLTRWVPYAYWRYLHRVMPLIYLALASHASLLAPLKWWQQPTGWLMALHIHDSQQGQRLSASQLQIQGAKVDI